MAYFWITGRNSTSGRSASATRRGYDEPQRVRIGQWGANTSFATTHRTRSGSARAASTARGRRGGAARITATRSTLAGLLVLDGRGRCDQRGLRPLPRRHRLRGPVRARVGAAPRLRPPASSDPRPVTPTGTRSRLHVDRAALPAARRPRPPLPEDLRGEVHADGRIWSRALWDLRGELGARVADTVVLEGQFGFGGGTMPALAEDGRGRGASTATPRPTRPRRSSRPGHPRLTRQTRTPRCRAGPRRRLERPPIEESSHARRCTNHARTHLGGG